MLIKCVVIAICVLVLVIIGLALSLYIQKLRFDKKIDKIGKDFAYHINQYSKKMKEIVNDANSKKDSIHGSDDTSNFQSSINILHDLSKKS